MNHHNSKQVYKPAEMITQCEAIYNAAEAYISAGFALVPMPLMSKTPKGRGWNKQGNALTKIDQLKHGGGYNIGLAHAYSGTCCIDIDHYMKADEYFADNGLNLTALLTAPDAVQIKSGRPNRAKLLYRVPEAFSTFQYIEDKETIVEFRCATANGLTVQDVLPPSIHPDTGKPYTWQGDWKNLPLLPGNVAAFVTKKGRSETPKDHNPHRKDISPGGITISPMGICSAVSQLGGARHFSKQKITPVTQDDINQLSQDDEVQKHLLTFLGFRDFAQLFDTGTVSVRSPFREDTHKSGGLVIGADSSLPMFHDFGGAFGSHYLQLNSLYASLISGSLTILKPTVVNGRKIGSVTSAVWSLRLLIDAGVIAPCKVDMPDCPVGANKTIQKVQAGIKRLFEVRWTFKDREGQPITLGRKFVGSWCGVSEDQARESMKYLPKHCIHTAGKHGLANIYLPGYKPPKKPKGRTQK